MKFLHRLKPALVTCLLIHAYTLILSQEPHVNIKDLLTSNAEEISSINQMALNKLMEYEKTGERRLIIESKMLKFVSASYEKEEIVAIQILQDIITNECNCGLEDLSKPEGIMCADAISYYYDYHYNIQNYTKCLSIIENPIFKYYQKNRFNLIGKFNSYDQTYLKRYLWDTKNINFYYVFKARALAKTVDYDKAYALLDSLEKATTESCLNGVLYAKISLGLYNEKLDSRSVETAKKLVAHIKKIENPDFAEFYFLINSLFVLVKGSDDHAKYYKEINELHQLMSSKNLMYIENELYYTELLMKYELKHGFHKKALERAYNIISEPELYKYSRTKNIALLVLQAYENFYPTDSLYRQNLVYTRAVINHSIEITKEKDLAIGRFLGSNASFNETSNSDKNLVLLKYLLPFIIFFSTTAYFIHKKRMKWLKIGLKKLDSAVESSKEEVMLQQKKNLILSLKLQELHNMKKEIIEVIKEQENIGPIIKKKLTQQIHQVLSSLDANENDPSENEHLEELFYSGFKHKFPCLSKKDFELACLVLKKKSNKEIAQIKHITVASVKQYKNRLKKKLQLTSDDDLTNWLTIFTNNFIASKEIKNTSYTS